MKSSLLLLLCLHCSSSLKILAYNPVFAFSHSHFLNKIADTLAEAGHEVVMLSPIVQGTHLSRVQTKHRTIIIPEDPLTAQLLQFNSTVGDTWTQSSFDPTAMLQPLLRGAKAKAVQCEATLKTPSLIEQLKEENFDVGYSETLDLCGFAIFHLIALKKYATTMSLLSLDGKFDGHGCPSFPSYVPGMLSPFSDEMTFLQRVENVIAYGLTMFFADNYVYYNRQTMQKLYPGFPDLIDIVANSTYFFFNSEPLIDFPRPTIHKFINIGGITVDTRNVKPLDEKWTYLLKTRPQSVLISFGTVSVSHRMPQQYKESILEAVRAFANVTFIWKYEVDDENITKGIDNLVLAKWIPQTEMLMSGLLSAFVTHSGAGSMTETIVAGVPMVAIPTLGDQLRNAKVIERMEIGIVLSKEQLSTPQPLVHALYSVLADNKYSNRARLVSQMVVDQPQSVRDRLVSHFEYMAKYGPLPHLNHASTKMGWISYYALDVFVFLGTIAISSLLLLISILYIVSRLSFKVLIRPSSKTKSE